MVAGVVAGLVGARLRHAGGRWRIVAVGLAAGAAIPVLIAGSAAVTADAALRRGVADLPPGDRTVVVSYNGLLDRSEAAAVDRDVRSQLPRVAAGPVRRQLIYRAMSDRAGGTFTLGATDDLGAAVRLLDGRLPRSCTPTRCEVVVAPPAGGGAGDPALPPIGLVIVGHAVRTDPLLLSGTFEPEAGRPLLLADGVDAAASIESLSAFQRSYGWVTPLDIRAVHRLGVTGWIRAGTDMADELWRRQSGLVVTTPDDALAAQATRAQSSSRRFALLGGTAGVLLLGAAVAGGAALRHDHARFVGALQRRGASPRQVMAVVVGEVAATAAAGAVLGVALGSGVTAVLAARGDLPVLATVGRAVAAGAPAVLALAALAGVLLAVTLRRAAERDGVDDATWRAVGLSAVTAAAVAALLAARGGVGVSPEGGSVANDPLLPALPALVLVAAALVAARGWPLMARTMQRFLPRRAIAARLGVGAVAARPLRAAATAALLTAAVGGSVFAGAYRATLERGSGDQAAFAVPTTARVTAGSTGLAPLDVAAPANYAAVASGATAYPVLRLAGSLRVRSVQAEAVQFVGLDPRALTDAARWKAVTGGPGAADVAKELTPVNPPADGRGVALPAGRLVWVVHDQRRVEAPVELQPAVRVKPVRTRVRYDELQSRRLPDGYLRGGDARDAVGVVADRQAVPVHAGRNGQSVADADREHIPGADTDQRTGNGTAVGVCVYNSTAQVDPAPGGREAQRPGRTAAPAPCLDLGDDACGERTGCVTSEAGERHRAAYRRSTENGGQDGATPDGSGPRVIRGAAGSGRVQIRQGHSTILGHQQQAIATETMKIH
jgi:hypothetical protein